MSKLLTNDGSELSTYFLNSRKNDQIKKLNVICIGMCILGSEMCSGHISCDVKHYIGMFFDYF